MKADSDINIAKYIEHTCLRPNAVKADIEKLCLDAVKYNFKGVCVNPSFVSFAADLLKGKKPMVVAVVGFPLGASQGPAKAFEAKEAIASGAEEIDMVVNIGAVKEKDYKTVFEDISGVVNEVRPHHVKVIIETCFLTREEKIIAAALAEVAGADFIKTSTGFGSGGATVADIELLKSVIGKNMRIKAAGGIKTKKDALAMITAGADRIGASLSLDIVR